MKKFEESFEEIQISNKEILERIKIYHSIEFYNDIIELYDIFGLGAGIEQKYYLVSSPKGDIKHINLENIKSVHLDMTYRDTYGGGGSGYVYIELIEENLDNVFGYLKIPFYY